MPEIPDNQLEVQLADVVPITEPVELGVVMEGDEKPFDDDLTEDIGTEEEVSEEFRLLWAGRADLHPHEAYNLAQDAKHLISRYNMTAKDLAKAFGYTKSTFMRLCLKHPVIEESILAGKKIHMQERIGEYAEKTEDLMGKHGFTVEELAKVLGISRKTFHQFVNEYPQLDKAYRSGRDKFDSANTERSLLRRALGYTYKEVTVKEEEVLLSADGPKNGNGKAALAIKVPAKKVTTTTTKKHIPPDVTAQQFWLTNRNKERWQNNRNIGVEGGLKHLHVHDVRIIDYDKNDPESVRRAYAHSFGEAAAALFLPAPARNGNGDMCVESSILDLERSDVCVDV